MVLWQCMGYMEAVVGVVDISQSLRESRFLARDQSIISSSYYFLGTKSTRSLPPRITFGGRVTILSNARFSFSFFFAKTLSAIPKLFINSEDHLPDDFAIRRGSLVRSNRWNVSIRSILKPEARPLIFIFRSVCV